MKNKKSSRFASILFIAIMIATVAACKSAPAVNEESKPELIPANNEQVENQTKANDEQTKSEDELVFSELIEKVNKNRDAINRCFEEFEIEKYNQYDHEPGVYPVRSDRYRFSIDKNGNVKYLILEGPGRIPCIDNVIKSFKFESKNRSKMNLILQHSNTSIIQELGKSDTIRECFEWNYMNSYSDAEYIFDWIIDKSGNPKNIKFFGTLDDKDCYSETKIADENETEGCIEDAIANTVFNPTTTQQDVPVTYSFINPYDYEIMKFEEENIDELKKCYEKGKVDLNVSAGRYNGFIFVINPDGSIKSIEYTNESNAAMDTDVANCYINILKQLRFKPTLTGKTLNMLYRFDVR